MANSTVKSGGWFAGCGCVFAISPLIMSLVTAPFNSGADVWHWYLISTVPMGAVVVLAGLIIATVGGIKGAKEGSAGKAETEPTAGEAKSEPTAGDAP